MDGFALYGAVVGTVSLGWQVSSQIRARRPRVRITQFIQLERPGRDRPAWVVIRIVNGSQRHVTLTQYQIRPPSAQSYEGWRAFDPPVTVPAHGGVHDVRIPMDDFPGGVDEGIAVRLSTGEMFKAKKKRGYWPEF